MFGRFLLVNVFLAVGPQEDGSESSHLSAELPPLPAHCPTAPQSHRPHTAPQPLNLTAHSPQLSHLGDHLMRRLVSEIVGNFFVCVCVCLGYSSFIG